MKVGDRKKIITEFGDEEMVVRRINPDGSCWTRSPDAPDGSAGWLVTASDWEIGEHGGSDDDEEANGWDYDRVADQRQRLLDLMRVVASPPYGRPCPLCGEHDGEHGSEVVDGAESPCRVGALLDEIDAAAGRKAALLDRIDGR